VSASVSEISVPKSDGYVSQDLFLAIGRKAAGIPARSDFKMVLIALTQKRSPQYSSEANSHWLFSIPNTGSARRDLVSIFIAFRVEEFQFVAGGLSGRGERHIILPRIP
jgi:hypothetical protein